jgi:hypothetical protein
MAYENENLTTLYFHCEDLKKKKAIANLFRHSLEYGVRQSHDVVTSHYEKFCVKLKNLNSGNTVNFDFFRQVLFGLGLGPSVVACPNKGAVYIVFLHGDKFGDHPRSLVEFVCSLDAELESAAESSDIDSNRYLWLKKLKGRELESRQFEHDSDRIDPDLLSQIEDTYEWLQESLSFTATTFRYTVDNIRALAVREEKPASKISNNANTEIVKLFMNYGLLSETSEVSIDKNDDRFSFFVNVLEENAANRIVAYPLVQGGWMGGKLVDEYASLIVEFCKRTNITIENLVLSPPLDEYGEEDPELDMSISFIHKGKIRKWTFSMETEEEYFSKFSRWAKSAVGGGYLWFTLDTYTGYLLPKGLVADLKNIGIPGEE